MKKIKKEFVKDGDKLQVVTTVTEDLSDTGVLYLAHKSSDDPYAIYKLQKCPNVVDDLQRYIWVALWNTCCWTGERIRRDHVAVFSIQQAIEGMQKQGFTVKATTFCKAFNNFNFDNLD